MCDRLEKITFLDCDNRSNNITLDLYQTSINVEGIDWNEYSRDILDSIKLHDDKDKNKDGGVNPFKEEYQTKEQYDFNVEDFDFEEIDEGPHFPDTCLTNNNNSNNNSLSLNNYLNLENNEDDHYVWDVYKLKYLQTVAQYYNIPYKKKTKSNLIEDLIMFENNLDNHDKVIERKSNWKIMNKLYKDPFFKKFIINWE